MSKEILKPDFSYLKGKLDCLAIDNDYILIDDFGLIPFFEYPMKQNIVATLICLKGSIDLGINLKRYHVQAPCFIAVGAAQIVQYFHKSDDLSVRVSIMSQSFGESLQLNIQQVLPLWLYLKENPVTPLNEEELTLLLDYQELLRKVVSMQYDPFRKDVVRHLMQAFFYSANHIFEKHMKQGNGKVSRKEVIFRDFLQSVQQHYKEERSLTFYADKLCLTSKHLSATVKNASGKSANYWIDEHVVLEAKALLKSTNMTIQQISDELNFANQSFFGKYFKQHAGMSPKDYKGK